LIVGKEMLAAVRKRLENGYDKINFPMPGFSVVPRKSDMDVFQGCLLGKT